MIAVVVLTSVLSVLSVVLLVAGARSEDAGVAMAAAVFGFLAVVVGMAGLVTT